MLASLLAASPCALTVADAGAPDQPVLFVNAVWERRTGYAAAEALGRNLRFLQAPPGARARCGGCWLSSVCFGLLLRMPI